MLPFAANEQVLYSAAPEAHGELSGKNSGAIKAVSARRQHSSVLFIKKNFLKKEIKGKQ